MSRKISAIFINEATEILSKGTNKCSWHPDIYETCTHNFPISNHHCPDCDFCMICGGYDIPSDYGFNVEILIERVKERNKDLVHFYGKSNG